MEHMEPFIYELDNQILVFQCLSPNYIMKCPSCKLETRYIIRHVNLGTSCIVDINKDEFKRQFLKYKNGENNEMVKEKQKKEKQRVGQN